MEIGMIKKFAITALVVGTLAACSDSPTSSPLPAGGPPSLAQLDNPISNGRTPVAEYFQVCKDYVDAAGAPTTGPDVTVVVSGPGFTGPVTLSAGQCKNVWIAGGSTGQVVTVTETVPNGYTASYVKKVLTNVPSIITYAPVVGNSANSQVSGSGAIRGAVVIFTNALIPPPPPEGCTYTQGYWKTHSNSGPAPYDNGWANLGALEENTVFFNSGKTWIALWRTPVKGSAYVQLAHQYMAAKLNILNGASAPASVTAAITAAESYFTTGTGNISGLASLLASYNEGTIGPGHCNDGGGDV